MNTKMKSDTASGGSIAWGVGFVIGTIIILVALMAPAYLWMAFLVGWLKYDYVTSSNVYFLLVCFFPVSLSIIQLFAHVNVFKKVLGIVYFLGIVPFLIALGLSVYQYYHSPVMSHAFDLVGAYRSAINYGFTSVIGGVASLAPALGAKFGVAYNGIKQDPMLSLIAASLIVSALKGAARGAFTRLGHLAVQA
jgi:hypothetical protein